MPLPFCGFRTFVVCLLAVVALTIPVSARGTLIHVDPGAAGNEDGTSWTDAYLDLTVALAAAGPGDSIWVAQGTFRPTSVFGDRLARFQIPDGVTLIGGFQGTESVIGDRVLGVIESILSGDVGIPGDSTDNSVNVVQIPPGTVTLDGFTIRDGNADLTGFDTGGGINADSATVTLINLVIRNNTASSGGGGVAAETCSTTVINCRIENNVAHTGGGLQITQGTFSGQSLLLRGNAAGFSGGGLRTSSASITLTDVSFEVNQATGGGGGARIVDGSATLSGVRFLDNAAGSNGGGLAVARVFQVTPAVSADLFNVEFQGNQSSSLGGGLHLDEIVSVVTNGTIYGNTSSALWGGGISIANGASVDLYNTITWENSAVLDSSVYVDPASSVSFTHCLIEASGGSGAGWDSDLGTDGGNNLDVNPQFRDAGAGDLRLVIGSPAFEAGTVSAPGLPALDLDGNPRISGDAPDLGAYELQLACQSVLFVDGDVPPGGGGTSWTDAFNSLGNAFTVAVLCPTTTEIWVAEGTYVPSTGTGRSATFLLRNGLGVYGGFGGTEVLRSERDVSANPTVLGGDIGIQADSTDNAYHVVSALTGVDSTAILDGFTITSGLADGIGPDEDGGGIFVSNASPTLSGLVIQGNVAAGSGGGMFIEGPAVPAVRDVRFEANRALRGGGLFETGAPAALDRVTFLGNQASTAGGGMYGEGGGVLQSSVFDGNTSQGDGGAVFLSVAQPQTLVNIVFRENVATNDGGALHVDAGSLDLINAVLVGNSAGTGGALHNQGTTDLINSILIGNTAVVDSEISIASGVVTHVHSLVVGSGGSGSQWDPVLGVDGGGNIEADPLFFDEVGGDFRLTLESPGINAGIVVPGVTVLDLDGTPRVDGGAIDLGPFESDLGLTITSISDVMNDEGRRVRIRFDASVYDGETGATPILQYEAYRRIDPLPWPAMAVRDRSLRAGEPMSASLSMSGWEYVTAIPATGSASYSLLAETLADSSIAGGLHRSVFRIRAASANPVVFFDSNPDSGYSIDNLAPAVPLGLLVEGPTLSWVASPEPDWRYYTVYTSVTGVLDGSQEVLEATITAESVDITSVTTPFVLVTALDFSGNESSPASISVNTGVGQGLPVVPALAAAWPNPASASTTITFDLPGPELVRLRVFDIRGRVVRTLVDEDVGAGRHVRTWSGETDQGSLAPSGVYFYRYEAGSFVQSRKMVLAR